MKSVSVWLVALGGLSCADGRERPADSKPSPHEEAGPSKDDGPGNPAAGKGAVTHPDASAAPKRDAGPMDAARSDGSLTVQWDAAALPATGDAASAPVLPLTVAVPCGAYLNKNSCEPDLAKVANPQTTRVTLPGPSGTLLRVSIRVRGVFEPKVYVDDRGDPITSGELGPHFLASGQPRRDGWQIYKLSVSRPAATFHLNAGNVMETVVYNVDYRASFDAEAGATLELSTFDPNVHMVANTNHFRYVIDDVAVRPQPFPGQFLVAEVVEISTK